MAKKVAKPGEVGLAGPILPVDPHNERRVFVAEVRRDHVRVDGLNLSHLAHFRGGVLGNSPAVVIDKAGSSVARMQIYVGDGTGGSVAVENYIAALNSNLHLTAGSTGTVPYLDIGGASGVSSGVTLTLNQEAATQHARWLPSRLIPHRHRP